MNTNPPREPSSTSWSVGANADSPSRYSVNESNRGMNVTRGDSLAYSEDSQDQRSLVLKGLSQADTRGNSVGTPKVTPAEKQPQPPKSAEVFKKPRNDNKGGRNLHLNESQLSEESLQERSKAACCSIQ